LALQYPKSSFNNGPLLIYLTSRDEGRGKAALADLQNDQQLKAAKALKTDGGLTDIKWGALDISDNTSINEFVKRLEKEHGQIDFYIGNAGIAMQGFGKLTALYI
jgi:carbonyl reductase 1